MSAASVTTAVRWRAVGLLGARALGMLRSALLAWLVLPADFGVFAMAMLPLEALLGATDVGVSRTVVRAESVSEHEAAVVWTVGVLRGVVVAAVLLGIAPLVASAFGEPRVAMALRVLALRPALSGLTSIAAARRERALDFRAPALIDLAGAIVQAIVTLALARTQGLHALLAGALAGAAAGAATSYVVAPWRPRFALDRNVIARFRQFGTWLLLASVAGSIAEAALAAAIRHGADTSAYGAYALAASLALVPAAMVGSLMSGVGFAVHARIGDDVAQRSTAFATSLIAMALLVLPAYALLVAAAPALATLLPGDRWRDIAPIVQWLAAAAVLGLVFDAAVTMLTGAGAARAASAVVIAFLVAVMACAWPLASRFGAVGGAISRVIAEVGATSVAIVMVRRTVVLRWQELGAPLLAIAAAACSGGVVSAMLLRASPDLAHLALSLAVGLTTCGAVLAMLDRVATLGLWRVVRLAVRSGT